MPLPQVDKLYVFTSTGTASTRIDGTQVREWTIHAETPSGSTGGYEMQVARSTASGAIAVQIGSSRALTSSGGVADVIQFSGPFAAIFPRCYELTNGGTLRVRVIGN